MKLIFIGFILFSSLGALACEISQPSLFSLAISPKEKTFFAYSVTQTLQEVPAFRAFNCAPLAMSNKFLMVAFGPQNIELTDRVGVFDFADRYTDSGAVIENSPFKTNQTFEDRKKYLAKKWHFIKSCMSIYLEEEANTPLNMPSVQPGCSYSKLGKNKMNFNGGFCFVKPGFGSSYIIKLAMKEECKHFEGLENLKVDVSDMETLLNFYSAGDATGTTTDLTALSTFSMRITVAPDERITSISDDYGIATPQFPVNYPLPDIHLGSPEAFKTSVNRNQLRIPYWVDNNCKNNCKFAQPVVGQAELFELKNNQETFLTSWFEGGVAQPSYQGEIAGTAFELPDEYFTVGESYRVRVRFNDPKFDFERFKNRIKSRMGTMEQHIGQINRSDIRSIPQTPSVSEVGQFPTIAPIPGISFSADHFNTIERAVEGLRSYLSFKLWPPYYDKICDQNNGRECHGIKDDYLTLTVDFAIESFNPEERKFTIQVKKIERKSKFLENYSIQNPKMPYIKYPY